MIGYMNAVLERQDKFDAVKKMETFGVETAARKALSQLTEHFLKLDKETKTKLEENNTEIRKVRKKLDAYNTTQ